MKAAGRKGALRPGQVMDELQMGKKIVFRTVRKGDEYEGMRHINSLIAEKAYIGWQKKCALKDEKKWVRDNLANLTKGTGITVVVEEAGRIIGAGEVFKKPSQAKTHVAYLGISLSAERGKGIGYRLMQILESLARKHFKSEMIELTVFEPNTPARKLYEKCGFIEFGKLKKGCRHHGKYLDEIFMVKYL